jgi:hypothetical protein
MDPTWKIKNYDLVKHSPDTILSFLLGDMKRQKFRTMVDEAGDINNDGTVKG